MAHAAAVVGLVVPGVLVENVGTTAKTYPGFVTDWAWMVT
jgi:3-phosphoshikimate 1-carboxyvinyltransferase